MGRAARAGAAGGPAKGSLSSRDVGLRLATVQGCLQGSGYPSAKRDSNSSDPDFVSLDTGDGTRVDVDVLPTLAKAAEQQQIASSAAAGGGRAEQHGHALVSTAGQLSGEDRAKIGQCADKAG